MRSEGLAHASRGVQCVHWVMHTCIMVKIHVGGKRNTCKACTTLLNFLENRGEILKSRGEIINFRESGGKCTKAGKIGGNPKFVAKKKKVRNFGG